MTISILVENNDRLYDFILRTDHKGGLKSFPSSWESQDQRTILHTMNATATDLIEDADKYLTPEQAAKVKAHIALIAAVPS